MIVVKLGGSLFDHPNLRRGLNSWLELQPKPILLIAGGGDVAECVRTFDRLHNVGEEAAHWAAVRSLAVTASLLRSLISVTGVECADVYNFCREDTILPHTWDVTTDSISLRIAGVRHAKRLLLLKSQDRPAGTWDELAANGYVDRFFPQLAKTASLPIDVVNFRRWLDDSKPTL
jgi:5-(aminomethyl)-3-furanmethanol phosphate kinase